MAVVDGLDVAQPDPLMESSVVQTANPVQRVGNPNLESANDAANNQVAGQNQKLAITGAELGHADGSVKEAYAQEPTATPEPAPTGIVAGIIHHASNEVAALGKEFNSSSGNTPQTTSNTELDRKGIEVAAADNAQMKASENPITGFQNNFNPPALV